MEAEVDHYSILGLPSGEEGAKLSQQEINKGFRFKARELHPDKRPDDPKAHENFQKLQASYEILKDEKARKLFDDLLKVKREKRRRQEQQDSKRQKMMSDLDRRERYSYSIDPEIMKHQEEEERTARRFREEVARIRAMEKAKRMSATTTSFKNDSPDHGQETKQDGVAGLDMEKILKVSWEKSGQDYTAQSLREIFMEFGVVEDVVKRDKRRSALVVMESKDAAVAATGVVLGELSNPLLVKPCRPAPSPIASVAEKNDFDAPKIAKLVGSGYQAYENSVLEKLKKAAEKQK